MTQEQLSQIVGDSWSEVLLPVFNSAEMLKLQTKLATLSKKHVDVFPEKKNIFRAFKLTPLDKLKVVIIGQDPYHTPGKATGLAFAVPKGETLPPSLKIIFSEIENDYFSNDFPPKDYSEYDSTLENWAEQGVLLLNTAFTVTKGNPGVHAKDWEWFTKSILDIIGKSKDFVIFVKWGQHAQKYDTPGHVVFSGPHPMAQQYTGGKTKFKGFFKGINNTLEDKGIDTIKWY